ncbi:acyl-CoA N-acyltransferase [Jackrogersella minutella]|nr:acyl-CoA N-acyltransferase [Jackrogersella minutella]
MVAKVASTLATTEVPGRLAYEVIVCDALVSDAAAIAQIGTETFTATFGFAVPDDDLAGFLAKKYSAEAFEAEIVGAQENKISTFVARDDASSVLGFVQLVRGVTDPCLQGEASSHAELQRLYIDVSAQGRGIGSKLIAAVENQAKAEGFKLLWLTVWENGSSQQRLYQKLGYVKRGETEFPLGNCVHRDWVMAKTLD